MFKQEMSRNALTLRARYGSPQDKEANLISVVVLKKALGTNGRSANVRRNPSAICDHRTADESVPVGEQPSGRVLKEGFLKNWRDGGGVADSDAAQGTSGTIKLQSNGGGVPGNQSGPLGPSRCAVQCPGSKFRSVSLYSGKLSQDSEDQVHLRPLLVKPV